MLSFDQYSAEMSKRARTWSVAWEALVAFLVGAVPWCVRMVSRRDVGMPELTDVVLGAVTFLIMESIRRSGALRVVGYQLYKEEAEKTESAQARIASLQESVAALQAQVSKVITDQAFADVLTESYNHGLHEIMNWKRLRKHSQFTAEIANEWHGKEKEWTAGVRQLLEAHGCNAQIVAHFWNIHKVELGAYHTHTKMNHALSMFSIRLDRLKSIIDMYSETPILAR